MIRSISFLLLAIFTTAAGVAPTIDLSHNMRILKLPMDTKPGSLIYRLRGSDPDNDVLTFGVRGDVGNQLLDIQSVTETRANVFLKAAPTEKEYKFTIYVTDSIQTTEVESTIIITNSTNQKSPFLEYDSLITVSELTEEKEVIGSVVVRKRNSSSLPVLFELEGSDKFAIRYLISPLKEATKGEIFLLQKVDYEKKNLYTITIYALNPWTDEEVDTRNVAVLTILVAVKDAQDTPPVFHSLPPVVRVSDSLPLGGEVLQVSAEDGDYGNQRNISYSFVPESSGVTYFNIHSRTGIITLASSTELLRESYSNTGPFVLSIQASEVETDLIPGLPASSEATVAVVLVNTENKPPRFYSKRYVASIEENSAALTPVIWEGPDAPKVVDDDQGKNGSFELFLEDDGGAFSVQPAKGMNELNFALLVKDPTKLDFETSDTKYIEFKIVARETASVRPLSATAEIRVKLLDANDNVPVFSHEIYNVTIPEDAPAGTTLTRIQATDEDSGSFGVVRYTAVNGPIAGNLHLDPVTGDLTLIRDGVLDRERVPEFALTVEARDDVGKGTRSTAEVRVAIADANDNAPLFLQPRYDAVLNPDMRNFYEPLRVQAYDADDPGPNSDITYEIVNGNYQEKFLIDPHTGELSLQAPLVQNPEAQDHGLPVITLTVRAHDQGVPVRFATVKVQVHNQEYLNRSISFVVPLSVKRASERRQELERGFSALTGAHVNLHSIAFHNLTTEKSVVRCWVSYPLSSTVDLSNMEAILVRDFLEMKNKVAPEETLIHYKEEGNVQMNNDARRRHESKTRTSWVENQQLQQNQATTITKSHVRGQEDEVPSPHHRAQQAAVHLNDTVTTSYAQNPEVEAPVRGAYYPDGGIPVVAGERLERVYRRSRPLSPGTEMLVHELGTESDARRLGNYVVVRKVARPRVRVEPAPQGEDEGEGPRRTEILYIRSPMREDEEERHFVREGDLLRSVSETALNDDAHLRAPQPTYRVRPQRPLLEPPPQPHDPASSQQLKFSRYHRTEGDVIIATDDSSEIERPLVGTERPWGASYNHPGEYSRLPRHQNEQWDNQEYHTDDYRPRFPPEPILNHPPHHGYPTHTRLPHGPMRGPQHQPTYIEQFAEQDYPQRQTMPRRQSVDHQRSHLQQQPYDQREPEERPLPTDWSNSVHVRQTDDIRETNRNEDRNEDDNSRTVVMAPEQSQSDEQQQDFHQPPQQFDLQEDQEQHNVRFHPDIDRSHQQFEENIENQTGAAAAFDDDHDQAQDQPRRQSEGHFQATHPQTQDEEHFQPNHSQQHDDPYQTDHDQHQQQIADHYHRRQSVRPMTQILSTTDDSGAPMSRDRLGPEETDLFDSRETHEESDRLGPRTTEDEVSRTEDLNPPTEDEDSDSGIGKDGTALRLKKSNLMEKKSLFTIAYDGMQTRGLKSAGERDDSP
ncbi:hypothetical protein JTE90_004620 [Oedothorax gibbosus]|uniref:Cadherin domain-containing protein n=1 Tax=Oedothorax gibbosus TaxID=931172 RepID=A0AAV6UPS4_9ARAC|nr:hypothetical protein JTE90_004620 [Oedothorax gibbosus]